MHVHILVHVYMYIHVTEKCLPKCGVSDGEGTNPKVGKTTGQDVHLTLQSKFIIRKSYLKKRRGRENLS